jgi:hypothetical protein
MYFTRFMMGTLPAQMLMLSASMLAAAMAATQTLLASRADAGKGQASGHKGSGGHKEPGAGEGLGTAGDLGEVPHGKAWPAITLPISPRPREFTPEPESAPKPATKPSRKPAG